MSCHLLVKRLCHGHASHGGRVGQVWEREFGKESCQCGRGGRDPTPIARESVPDEEVCDPIALLRLGDQ